MVGHTGPIGKPILVPRPVVDFAGDNLGTTFDAIIVQSVPFLAYDDITLNASADALLFAVVATPSANHTVSYGGQSLTSLATAVGSATKAELFGLLKPPLTSSDLIINSSEGDHRIGWAGATFKNVNPNSLAAAFPSVVTAIDNVGSSPTTSVGPVSSAPVRKVWTVMGAFSVPVVSMSDHQLGLFNASNHNKVGSAYADGAASVTMSGTLESANLKVLLAVDIAPV